MFKLDTFTLDFTGVELGIPVWEQVKNTMLITLWVFIGVEGAVVVSARAKNKRDVGRATLLAVLAALGIYLLVTLLSLGVLARPELAEMRNPSMAGLIVKMMRATKCARRAFCIVMAHQYLCANLSGADLADRFGLQHAIDDCVRNDSGALLSGRRISAEDCNTSPPSGGRYRSLYLWLMVVIRVGSHAPAAVRRTVRAWITGFPVCASDAQA